MVILNLNLAVPAFPVRLQTSILGAVDFTSVFEMGTGVSPLLYPPGNFIEQFCVCDNLLLQVKLIDIGLKVENMVKTLGLLVLVSLTHYYAYTPSLSTL